MNNEPVNNVVQATDITRIYHLGRSEVAALRGVNLCVRAGEFVAVRGRSGSGKTTLLNIIGGLDRPDSGTVLFDDRDVTRLAASNSGCASPAPWPTTPGSSWPTSRPANSTAERAGRSSLSSARSWPWRTLR
jgi:energy-coupling factor transporter ATP-binding protein EcfA2